MMRYLAPVAVLLISMPSWAGVTELGMSASHRKSTYDVDNYSTSTSYTASISYYFMEMSAIEISYTSGESRLTAKPSGGSQLEFRTIFELIGLDLVFTFAGRKSAFQPYIKAGGAYLEKEFYSIDDVGTISKNIQPQYGLVPSAGIGFKIRLSQTWSLKVGAEAWKTPAKDNNDNAIFDLAGRAGISWMF